MLMKRLHLLEKVEQVNNSDKGSGNTLQSSSRSYRKNQKSIVFECIKPRYKKYKKKGECVMIPSRNYHTNKK